MELNCCSAPVSSSAPQVWEAVRPLPLCAWCNRVREASGHWQSFHSEIDSQALITHGVCPDCLKQIRKESSGGGVDRDGNEERVGLWDVTAEALPT